MSKFDFDSRDWKSDDRDWHNEFVLIILFNYDNIDFDMLCLAGDEMDED